MALVLQSGTALVAAGQAPDVLESGPDGPVIIRRGAGTPITDPVLHIDMDGDTGPNLVEMRGSLTGAYALWITDTCAIVTNGQVNANSRWSPTNGVSPLVDDRAYNFGSASDYNQNASKTFALNIALSAHADLDYFQGFKLGDTRHRIRINEIGAIGWADGGIGYGQYLNDPIPEPDAVRIFPDPTVANPTLTIQIHAAHDPALRVQEAADGDTALLVRRNVAGVFSLEQVSMGVPGSGGVGFKLLRVPN